MSFRSYRRIVDLSSPSKTTRKRHTSSQNTLRRLPRCSHKLSRQLAHKNLKILLANKAILFKYPTEQEEVRKELTFSIAPTKTAWPPFSRRLRCMQVWTSNCSTWRGYPISGRSCHMRRCAAAACIRKRMANTTVYWHEMIDGLLLHIKTAIEVRFY